jgi:hypothetical protein
VTSRAILIPYKIFGPSMSIAATRALGCRVVFSVTCERSVTRRSPEDAQFGTHFHIFYLPSQSGYLNYPFHVI